MRSCIPIACRHLVFVLALTIVAVSSTSCSFFGMRVESDAHEDTAGQDSTQEDAHDPSIEIPLHDCSDTSIEHPVDSTDDSVVGYDTVDSALLDHGDFDGIDAVDAVDVLIEDLFSVPCDFTAVRRLTDMPVALRTVGATPVVEGKLYILGGTSESSSGSYNYSEHVYEYDILDDSYRDLGPILPYGLNIRPRNIARADNGKFYSGPLIGTPHNGGVGSHSRIIEFDPSSELAAEKVSVGSTMWDMSAVNGGDGYIYLFGAWNGSSFPRIWQYDPSGDSIDIVATLPKPGNSMDASISASNGFIYVFGNHWGSQLLVFDPHSYTMHTITQPCDSIGPVVWEEPAGTLWSFCDFSTLVKFDLSTESFTTIPLAGDIYFPDVPHAMSVDATNKALYTFGGMGATMDRIASAYMHSCLAHGI